MGHRQFILLRKFIDKVLAEQLSISERAMFSWRIASHCLEVAMWIILTTLVTIGHWLGMSEFDE